MLAKVVPQITVACTAVRAFLTVTVVVLPPCVAATDNAPLYATTTNLHNQVRSYAALFRDIYCQVSKGRPFLHGYMSTLSTCISGHQEILTMGLTY